MFLYTLRTTGLPREIAMSQWTGSGQNELSDCPGVRLFNILIASLPSARQVADRPTGVMIGPRMANSKLQIQGRGP